MKRFLSVILCALFLLETSTAFAQEISIPFDDHEDHIYQEAIEYLFNEDIISGYPDGTFKPDLQIKRAELLKIIVESNFDEVDYIGHQHETCFPDVVSGEWFTKYVCFAQSRGIVEGYPDGYFRPELEVNLNESLKMIYEGTNLVIDNPDAIFKFKYYSPAARAGYIPDELLGGFAEIMTRAQVSEVMYRVLIDEDKVYKQEVNLGLTPHKQQYYASCATAALAAALSNTHSLTEDQIISQMIQIGLYPNNPITQVNGTYVWDDPQQVFVGDYNGIVSINMSNLKGFGFLESPLERLAKQWAGASEKFTGKNVSYIAQQLEEGYPVIVFANVNARNGEVFVTEPGSYNITWNLIGSDESITVPMYKHNLVVEGYSGTVQNPETFYIIDPFYGRKLEVTPSQLSSVLQGYNFSGVVIKN